MTDVKKCTNPAKYRFVWSGSGEAVCCERHYTAFRWVAHTLGVHLQFISLSKADQQLNLTCNRKG